jgi:cytochrome c oxidase subunit 2
MHIPVGQPVRLQLTSADVIHSFWVPQLGPKVDTLPGIINRTWTEASRSGTYRGECNVFCGIQHANMDFLVVADPPAKFAAWLRDQEAVPPQPTTATLYQGQQVFLGSACVYCHTIRGTNASGRIGPDLTHFGSRQSIGAGIVPNNPGYLGGWIANSQIIKPGNAMPPMNLPAKQLQQLLAYLESLK